MPSENRPSRSSWVTPELVAGRTIGLSDLRTWHGRIYWLEARPAEGRTVLVCAAPDGAISDVTDARINVGSRVHEYGGGAYAPGGAGELPAIFCSDRTDGGVWRLDGDDVRRVAGVEGLRYADFSVLSDGASAICVREDHRLVGTDGAHEPVNTLVWLDGRDPAGVILAEGADFYASPRLSPDGRHLAWIEWDHPSMPWDATRLKVAPVQRDETGNLSLGPARQLAGDDPESVLEPVWMADGSLVATTDRSGYWNPVDMLAPSGEPGGAPWPAMAAEIGLPHWVFGQMTMAPVLLGAAPGLLCLAIEGGLSSVCLLTRSGAERVDLGTPQNVPQVLGPAADFADSVFAWIDTPEDRPPAVVTGHSGSTPRVLRRATELPEDLPPDAISRPEQLRFPSGDGSAHALYYPPCGTVSGPPPLVVMAHGGPTGRASPAFSFKVQWWTSRGFAVLDVNYRGSTGFGRSYRKALDGQWAVADVADVLAGVRYAIETGRADPRACVIRGSSAGGLTVLCALAQSDLFAAGTSLYGVTDLRALAAETHKFEARYLDRLIGPYPQDEATYLARSPIAQASQIRSPVLFLHGSEDRVVPPAQATDMAEKLRAQGVRVAHHVYEGEGHGFRQQATLLDASERELAFYLDVFG
ncbi:S9 family peptidase [Tanticharoenia sakaeratensis]|uniref:Peptidase n=1 Tax=Tanticharoenia sakaeratensis NBRC 103193 TaxID=1231623 RepID=A0A0D6MJM7_9PROT|nr:prolyl oligopeptidase family serine peptidase [Tanticharoenia sakaeratensis]GAN53817.1 peptidase [Tanticharoenia sakaeratensis NBRC 103193]